MSQRRSRRRQHGAAIAEALFVLPILTLLYAGVLHLYRVQSAVLAARAQARACAWRYSNAGCRGGAPPGCENTTPTYDDIADPNDGEQTMWESAMAIEPLRWAFEGLLGTSVTVHAARKVSASPLFGDQEINVGSQLFLLCNEHNRTGEELATDTACSLIPTDSYLHDVLGCKGDDEWH